MENKRILVIKTSSLGDVVHCLSAVGEAKANYPQLQIDWVVERAFADIVNASDLVNQVFAIEFRKWRKKPLTFYRNPEVKAFLAALKQNNYDLVIDAQGLLKSAFLARHAKGKRVGFAKKSAREGLASLFYQQSYEVEKSQHAINRQRQLFAQALGYTVEGAAPQVIASKRTAERKRLLFLHGTTWQNKKLPLHFWQRLAAIANADGYQVELFYGNGEELHTAKQIAENADNVHIHDKLPLAAIINEMQGMSAVVAVDTGLAHIANAMNLPMLMLFGPTNPRLTGATSEQALNQQALVSCAPCMQRQCPKATGDDEIPCMHYFSAQSIYAKLKTLVANHG